jgi:NhaP-type Na+/H+ or K+/H+ antiporter
MALTVGLVALAGVYGLGLSWGAAVLLGAVLAPTDPVLASDVQVTDPRDRDHLRFALTGEAGLNDGAAFPFVMLGLGLLGLHEVGDYGLRWLAVDLGWRTAAGLAVGAACGTAVGRLVVHLRRTYHEALGTDAFLTLGLIALAYGAAEAAHGWGFLAVFAAGLALRHVEHAASEAEGVDDASPSASEVAGADDPEVLAAAEPYIPQLMARAVLGFNEQVERILEVAVVLLVGALLLAVPVEPGAVWFVPLLLLVIRPVAVYVGLLGAPVSGVQKGLAAWFGIRGIGSVYYLAYALTHGADGPGVVRLLSLVLWAVAVSVVAHGVSVTPLMAWYRARTERGAPHAR